MPSILDFFHLTLDSCMCSWHDWVISLYKDFLMFSVKLKLIFQLFWRWSKQSWVAVPRAAAGKEAKEKAREEKETTLELSGRWNKAENCYRGDFEHSQGLEFESLQEELVNICEQLYFGSVSTSQNKESQICISTFHNAILCYCITWIVPYCDDIKSKVLKMWLELSTRYIILFGITEMLRKE